VQTKESKDDVGAVRERIPELCNVRRDCIVFLAELGLRLRHACIREVFCLLVLHVFLHTHLLFLYDDRTRPVDGISMAPEPEHASRGASYLYNLLSRAPQRASRVGYAFHPHVHVELLINDSQAR
jgi:hypothetical protein